MESWSFPLFLSGSSYNKVGSASAWLHFNSGSQMQSTLLCVDKFVFHNAWEIGQCVHNECIILSLREPLVKFKSQMSVNVHHPGNPINRRDSMGQHTCIAGFLINSWQAMAHQPAVVNVYRKFVAFSHFIVPSEMRDDHFSFHNALFHFQVEDIKSTEM